MISVIICYKDSTHIKNVADNVAKTISVDYELILIDNSSNKYSIFSAYNEGVRRSRGDVLCFMHDDVYYSKNGWGCVVEQILSDKTIGCLGVIGSYYLTKTWGYWDMMQPYVTGSVRCGRKGEHTENHNRFYGDNSPIDVVAIDGMWMCIPRYLFAKIHFDEDYYEGFHMYDMDICMQILLQGKRIVVERSLDIIHFCDSQNNFQFVQNMKKFHEKWDKYLPVSAGIEVDEKIALAIYNTTWRYCTMLERYVKYKNDMENSRLYRMSRFIKKILYFCGRK